MILGRLYRLIFGGSRYTKNHDAEVQAAQQRVNKALEGLDRDVLLLMKVTMLDGLDHTDEVPQFVIGDIA